MDELAPHLTVGPGGTQARSQPQMGGGRLMTSSKLGGLSFSLEDSGGIKH